MTRYWKLMLCMVIVLTATAIASAQSLGDVARKERSKQKPQAARTYTNEDIPSVYVPKEEAKADDAAPAGDATAEKKDGDKPTKSPAEEKAALNAEWKKKVDSEKTNIASIEREINLMEREEKVKAAVYYADAGNRLRNNKDWADQEQKYQGDLAARQKDLAAAKAKLDGVRESARKAGATSYE